MSSSRNLAFGRFLFTTTQFLFHPIATVRARKVVKILLASKRRIRSTRQYPWYASLQREARDYLRRCLIIFARDTHELDAFRSNVWMLAYLVAVLCAHIGLLVGFRRQTPDAYYAFVDMLTGFSFTKPYWFGPLATTLAAFAVFAYVARLVRIMEKMFAFHATFRMDTIWNAILLPVYAYVALAPPSAHEMVRSFQAAAMGGLYLTVGHVALFPLAGLMRSTFQRRQAASRPDVTAIGLLVDAREQLGVPLGWISANRRRSFLRHIEGVAVAVGRYWWRWSRSGDSASDSIVKAKCERWAAAFRELHIWVVSPQLSTRSALTARIDSAIIAIAAGDLHTLPEAEPLRLSVRSRVAEIGKAMAVAGLPAAVLALLLTLDVPLPSLALPWLSFGVYCWFVIAVITAFDSTVGAKMALMRDFRGALIGGRDHSGSTA